MPDFIAGPALGLTIAAPFFGREVEQFTKPAKLLDEGALALNEPLALEVPRASSNVNDDVDADLEEAPRNNFRAETTEALTVGLDWFERFHVLPRRIDFGNVVTPQTVPMEVYSAFRHLYREWTGFENNAGEGTELLGLPAFPHVFYPQSSGNLSLEAFADVIGQLIVDGDFTFEFDGTEITVVPITLQRIILFPSRPEGEYEELLEFLTDVLPHEDGSEQRVSLRENPRQILIWDLFLEDGSERSRIHNLLFDWQHRQFAAPLWHDLTRLTADTPAGSLVLPVRTTANRDFFVGGVVVIYTDEVQFDVLMVDAIGPTSITVSSPTTRDFDAGAYVAPVRAALASSVLDGSRFTSADARLRIRLTVRDNSRDAELADTSAFSTFNGKVLLDEKNIVTGGMSEQFERDITVIDNGTGRIYQDSAWDRGKRSSRKTFFAKGASGLWNVRRLLHALRGQQVSFYLPSFSEDLVPTAVVSSGSNQLVVENVGYTRFVQNRQPRNVVRVVPVSGTPMIRTVVSSVVNDENTETLTVDSNWNATYQPDEILRIDYVEEVRWASDSISIRHGAGGGNAKITGPVRTVNE